MEKNFLYDMLQITERQVEYINKLANNFCVQNPQQLYENIVDNICDTNIDGIFVSIADSIIHELYCHIIITLCEKYNLKISQFQYEIDSNFQTIMLQYNDKNIMSIEDLEKMLK